MNTDRPTPLRQAESMLRQAAGKIDQTQKAVREQPKAQNNLGGMKDAMREQPKRTSF